jgi:hypothetical protein
MYNYQTHVRNELLRKKISDIYKKNKFVSLKREGM